MAGHKLSVSRIFGRASIRHGIQPTRLCVWLGLVTIFVPVGNSAFAQTVAGSVREGNKYFLNDRYEHALKKYQAAQVESPEDERIGFNIGDAQYKLGNYNDALSEFYRSTQSTDPKLRAQSHYNAGNALYRMGRLEDAVDQYLRTLEIDPNDEDAKFNLEFVRREIERRQKDQQQRQERQGNRGEKGERQQGGGEADQRSKEQQKAQGAPPNEKGHQERDKQTGQQPEQSPEKKASGQSQPGETQPDTEERGEGHPSVHNGKMSRENVERWLDMVEAESADNMKQFLRQQSPREPDGYSQDW